MPYEDAEERGRAGAADEGGAAGMHRQAADLRAELNAALAHNRRLSNTLREARDQILTLKAEVDKLAQPPAAYGVYLASNDDGSLDILANGRKMRVVGSPGLDLESLRPGQEVQLNDSLNVVAAYGFEEIGEVATLKELFEDGERALVVTGHDDERVVRIAEPLRGQRMRAGDSLLLDARSNYVYERIPKAEVEELVLEEVPDVDYEDIGGLGSQIEQIRDAVELPFLHQDLFRRYELAAPKGILLYGPPGCGKTLIAKAVAHSLAQKVAERTGAARRPGRTS